MSRFVAMTIAAVAAAGCGGPGAVGERSMPRCAEAPIAVTSADSGRVLLLERGELALIRSLEPVEAAPAAGPMLVVGDAGRRVFYAGNFDGGLGRIPFDGGPVRTLDLGGVLIGSALSPDGRRLAVNGAHDLTARIVDLDAWRVTASVRFGDPQDTPLHSHMIPGLSSTHPCWLPDGSGFVTEDNVHEEVVLIGRDGAELARRRMRSSVHAFLTVSSGEVLALAEGTVDGTVPPSVVVLCTPALDVLREIVVPLFPDEPAKLHHGTLTPDEETVIVANMGPMHGERHGSTVAALRWRTGEVLWHVPTVRNPGHVRLLSGGRVAVLGHQAPDLAVLDQETGARLGTWSLAGAGEPIALGHSLAVEPEGTLLLIDSTAGQMVRVASDGIRARSPRLGSGVSEASLPE